MYAHQVTTWTGEQHFDEDVRVKMMNMLREHKKKAILQTITQEK